MHRSIYKIQLFCVTADNINVNGGTERDKVEDYKNGHTSVKSRSGGDEVLSHQGVISPRDGEGLEWMDYSSTRKKTPIHN